MTMVNDDTEKEINIKMDEAQRRWEKFMQDQPSTDYFQYYNEQIKPIKETEKKVLKRIDTLFLLIIFTTILLIIIWWVKMRV